MTLSSLSLPHFLKILFLILIIKTTAEPPSLLRYYCTNENGNYTNNSAHKTNLNTLLSSLPTTDGNGYGFYNVSLGSSSDTANAIGLCRGDVSAQVCRSCLENAAKALPAACPNQKEADGWYDYCMLRYSNRPIENGQTFTLYNSNNVSPSSEAAFFEALQGLFMSLKNHAASGGSLRKFASGKETVSESDMTIYAMVQCLPDFSRRDCNNCLEEKYEQIPGCCAGKIGVRVIGTSCFFRYEIRAFDQQNIANATPTVSLPPQTSATNSTQIKPGNGSDTSKRVIIVVVASFLGVSAVLIALVCLCLRMTKKKKAKNCPPISELGDKIETPESLQFDFETIRQATNDFSEDNKLGQGGFGPVYRGRLSNGQEIAVKRLLKGSNQGDLEFKNEVMLVAKLQHRNLVRLLGFCLERSERLLTYEFVENASLDHFIFDPIKRSSLDWEKRYKIIRGIARGLLYLHEDSRLRIIHRDLKASNILLDEEKNPKISDFGMARLVQVDQTQGNTRRIVGTYGYMAPEYVMHGQFSVKSDVYSFGVLLLEIISGQKNNNYRHGEEVEQLSTFAWKSWRKQTVSNFVDPLMGNVSGIDIIRCIHIALLCAQENVSNRPTMNTVFLMLSSNSLSLPKPSKPAYFMRSNIDSDLMSNSNSIK